MRLTSNRKTNESTKVFIQARMKSSRFPGKVLKQFSSGKSMLDMVISAVKSASLLREHQVVIVTSDTREDDPIEEFAKRNDTNCFRGSEEDVLWRFVQAARRFHSQQIVRVCADNPFLQSELLDELLGQMSSSTPYDYVGHIMSTRIPAIRTHFGFFAEGFTRSALEKANQIAVAKEEREHVTKVFYDRPTDFSLLWLLMPSRIERGVYRLTIDTPEDFYVVDEILKGLGQRPPRYETILDLIDHRADLLDSMKSSTISQQK